MGLLIFQNECPCCGSKQITKVLLCKDHSVTQENFEIWECKACTFRFTQAIPKQEEVAKYYAFENYISHTDSNKGLVNKIYKIARNYTLYCKWKLVKKHTQLAHGNLLDIGSGTGAFLQKMKSKNWQTLGLEPDEGARKMAEKKYNLLLQPSDALFALPPKSFDAVTLWHVLEHVHQLHNYLKKIAELLKTDGRLFIALPNYTSADAAHYKQDWAAYDVPRHLYHFSPTALKKLVEIHGLKVVKTKPMWLDAFYIAMLSEKYKHGKNKLLTAIFFGLKSNAKALIKKETCSSLIYVVKKC